MPAEAIAEPPAEIKPATPEPAATTELPPDDPWASLDASFTEDAREAKPAEDKPDEPKPDDKPREDKPADKPAEPKPADTKPAKVDDKPKGDGGPRALREQLEKVNGDLKLTAAERDQLKTKLAEIEKRATEATTLAEEVARLKKEREELVTQVETYKFEESPTFKQKHVTAWEKAVAKAQANVKELEVIVRRDEDTGQPVTRPATWDDFQALYQLGPVGAMKAAKQWFGDLSDVAMDHYRELHRLHETAQGEIAEHRATYAEQQKRQAAEAAQIREAVETMWSKVNEDLTSRHPEWQPDPASAEEKKIIQEAYALADSGFGDRSTQTLQQKVITDANIRHRAATQPLYAYRYHKLKERVAELEAEIAERESSKPGATKRGTKTAAAEDDVEDLLEQAFSGS